MVGVALASSVAAAGDLIAFNRGGDLVIRGSGRLIVKLGNGANRLDLDNVTVGGDLAIDGGKGDDDIRVVESGVGGNLRVRSGDDQRLVGDNAFDGLFQGFERAE